MEFFNDINVFNKVVGGGVLTLLAIAFCTWVLSEIISHYVYKRQREIYKNLTHYSTLDDIVLDKQRNSPGCPTIYFYGHCNLFKVTADIKVKGVELFGVDCGYLITDDYNDENFDAPFNRYLTNVLIDDHVYKLTDIDEVTFSLHVLSGGKWRSKIKSLIQFEDTVDQLSTVGRFIMSSIDFKRPTTKAIHELHVG